MIIRKFTFVLSLFLLPFILLSPAQAQEGGIVSKDSTWTFTGSASLTFTQMQLVNWVAGGQNSIGGEAAASFLLKYEKGRSVWTNSLDLGYAVQWLGEDPMVKNLDKIDFASQYGYKASKSWFYSGMLGLKTQFAPGFKYPDREHKISDFMSPLYMILSLGMDYRPNDNFHLFLSPLTGRMTHVRSQYLADLGAFGVTPAEYDAAGVRITPGKHNRWELGGFLKALYKQDLWGDRITVTSRLELFSNYLEKPQNIDVMYDLLLDFRLAKYLTARAQLTLIYDDDMKVTREDGTQVAKLQIRELFALGIAYRF